MNKIIISSSFVVFFASFQGICAVASPASHVTNPQHMNKENVNPFKEVSTEKMGSCVDEYPCS